MTESRRTSVEEAQRVGDAIGVDWSRFDLEQFRMGITGKIALAHMKEFPDYYQRLERMEREAERDWADKSR